MKTKVILFNEDKYALILTNPSEEILSLPDALINPDLSMVINLSPEYWKLENKQIVPMTEDEMVLRNKDLESETVKSNIVIKEVLVDKIVEKIVEVIKEVPVAVEKIITVEKNVVSEVIKEVPTIIEKIVEVVKEIPVEVLKEIEVIKNVETIVQKTVNKIPKWVLGVVAIQLVIIVLLLIK